MPDAIAYKKALAEARAEIDLLNKVIENKNKLLQKYKARLTETENALDFAERGTY